MPSTPQEIEQLVRQSLHAEVASMTLYARLANRVEAEDQRRLLRTLAAAEETHIGRLTELVGTLGEPGTRALDSIGLVTGLRHEANRRLDEQLAELGLSNASSAVQLLRFAIAMEARAGQHYQRLAVDAEDPDLRRFFAALVLEEEAHAEQLEHLRQMLEASAGQP